MDGVGPSGVSEFEASSRPKQLAFRGYVPGGSEPTAKKQPLHTSVRRRLVVRLTKDIVENYQTCNPLFKFSEELNPKRYLTSPSKGVLNDGHDNVNSDLILTVNYTMTNTKSQRRYIVQDVLGHGTFGQVAKCLVPETGSFVAVKIIKNQTAYYQQALVEVSVLLTINQKYDPDDKNHIVRIYDYFVHQRHLCICFELLDTNLFELIKINHFRGLSLHIVRLFSKQILRGLALLKDAGIIHCDLKPENILLCTSVEPAEVKIIDFGSACMENHTVYSYVQSRYYRSPEVLLGYQYTTAIDMWSFGCVVAELFLGLPLFPGPSEFDLLRRMTKILGQQPPDYILKDSKNTSKFFKSIGSVHNLENGEIPFGGRSAYQVLSIEEYEARDMKKPSIGKEYFQHMNLEAIVKNYPYRKNLPQEDIIRESEERLALIDFLRGLVEFDPAKRWSPFQASKHPFLTREPFTSPYKPPQETPCVPVAQNIKVDHHPGGGHWFAAGLSPSIPGRNTVSLHNIPHFQVVPYAHANNYGSMGSHGSYNDSIGIGNSYGSYGDCSNVFPYYSPAGPSGMHMHPQAGQSMLGSSPDARHRMLQYNHDNGLGMSPSAGNFAPLPLGTSPSQFTPPNSYGKVSAGSPNHHGPHSPRSGCHGSPLGKMAAAGQFNRRKSCGYAGNPQYQETSSTPHWQGQVSDGISSSHIEKNPSIFGSSPLHRHHIPASGMWMHHQGGGGASASYSAVQNIQSPQTEGLTHDKLDPSLPDPGDWDPNYSDELLLQEDNSDIGSISMEFSRGMKLSLGDSSTSSVKSSSAVNIQRQNGPVQVSSQKDIGSPTSTREFHGNSGRSTSKPSYFVPAVSQNFPSRLGQQQHAPRFNHGRGSVMGTEWNQMKVHPPPPSYSSGGPHSPGSGSSNIMPWGRRPIHPSTSIPPASRGRKDHARIT